MCKFNLTLGIKHLIDIIFVLAKTHLCEHQTHYLYTQMKAFKFHVFAICMGKYVPLIIVCMLISAIQLQAQDNHPHSNKYVSHSVSGGFVTDNNITLKGTSFDTYRIITHLDYGKMIHDKQMNGARVTYGYQKFGNNKREEYSATFFRRHYNFLPSVFENNRLGYFLEIWQTAIYAPRERVFWNINLGVSPAIYYALSNNLTIEYTLGSLYMGYGVGNSNQRINIGGNFNQIYGRLALRYFFD